MNGQGLREVERALERDVVLHDEGCGCGSCELLGILGDAGGDAELLVLPGTVDATEVIEAGALSEAIAGAGLLGRTLERAAQLDGLDGDDVLALWSVLADEWPGHFTPERHGVRADVLTFWGLA